MDLESFVNKDYYTSLFEMKNSLRGSFAQTGTKKFFQKLFSHNTPAPQLLTTHFWSISHFYIKSIAEILFSDPLTTHLCRDFFKKKIVKNLTKSNENDSHYHLVPEIIMRIILNY